MPSRLELAIRAYRGALLREEQAATQRLIQAYQPARVRLVKSIDELVNALQAQGTLTPGELARFERAVALSEQVEAEITRLSRIANTVITDTQGRMVAMAGDHSKALALVQGSGDAAAGLISSWNRLNPDAVEALVGRMSDGSPLGKTLSQFGGDAKSTLTSVLQQAVATGMNPRATSRILAQTIDAEQWKLLRIARHETLSSYRAATNQSYLENIDISDGTWTWISAHQSRTCLSCLSLDSQKFPITESFQPAHVCCRCSSFLNVKGEPSPQRQTGTQWFDAQSQATQLDMIPKSAHDEFLAGNLKIQDFVQLDHSEQWGDQYRQSSVATAKERAAKRTVTSGRMAKVKSFGSLSEADEWASQYQEWGASLKPIERETLGYYRGSGYHDINGVLREGKLNDSGEFADVPIRELRKQVKTMDAAIERSIVDRDVVAYRGTTTDWLGDVDGLAGTIIHDKGFVSTSLDSDIGRKFVGYKEEENLSAALMEITIPKGSRAAYLDTLNANSKPWERELLLPRGSSFRVTESVVAENGMRIIRVEVVE